MPWTPGFQGRLALPEVELRFYLESVSLTSSDSFEGSLKLASFDTDAAPNVILRDGSSIAYGSLRPSSWARSYGSLTIAISGDYDPTPYTARGQTVMLRVGLAGDELSDFQPVWMGQVRNLKHLGSHWEIECIEMPGALQNRFTSDPEYVLLFSGLSSTTLDENFDPDADAEFDVVSSSGFQRSSESGDAYCLLITPSGGNPYFLLADTLTSNTFEDLTLSPTPLLGTAPEEADEGSVVQEVAYTETHPLYVLLRVLTSTGSADNGAHDVLPSRWGFGIGTEWIDEADTDYFRDNCAPTSGTTQWQLVVTEEQEDALTFLSEWLRSGGFFVAMRQGLLTGRAIRSPYQDDRPWVDVASITDDHIIAGTISYWRYDPDSPIEYTYSVAGGQVGGSAGSYEGSSVESRPTRKTITRTLAGDFGAGGGTNEWADEVVERLGPWDVRVPERLELQTSGLSHAHLTLGDFVTVSSVHLPQPRNRSDPTTRRWMVVGGGPDWFQGVCYWQLITHPSAEVET